MSQYYVILFSLQSLPFRSKYFQHPVLSHFHAMNLVVFRKMTPCILVELYRRFRDTRQRGIPDDEGSVFVWIVGAGVPHCTASRSGRQQIWQRSTTRRSDRQIVFSFRMTEQDMLRRKEPDKTQIIPQSKVSRSCRWRGT